eukprot:6485699-Alexandrium_andersonii.AAC.1
MSRADTSCAPDARVLMLAHAAAQTPGMDARPIVLNATSNPTSTRVFQSAIRRKRCMHWHPKCR